MMQMLHLMRLSFKGDAGRPVKGSRIAILGAGYKPGVGDIRESPALKILALLSTLGAVIDI
jgi:UDP-N-acetyl-D-glucosamine dehydrogenase